jgi:hypothetical protein
MYSRTPNENGGFDSRCLDCLLTIACGIQTEAELDRLEDRHLCPEKVLAQLQVQKKAEAGGAAQD